MRKIKETAVIKRSTQVVGSNIDDQLVLMSDKAGKYYSINFVGSKIWEFLEAPMTFTELCKKLADFFDIASVPSYSDDVADFLDTLVAKELVEIDDED